ncbi:RNA polymerase II subunit B11 [Intoshia linei]|uniref:RNA polymerase II subunit B11 n=1 Tax=Intoshia linei TaxID=1819745 RepID=A0A177BA19_9BILA|nr:RNA polymerase II subunit B11 [Intoshia linei]
MNIPPTFSSFILGDEKKIIFEKDTKVPNSAIFTINKEDHTIGNLIKVQLIKDPNVVFAGYKVPHPLDHKVIVRVQTTGRATPHDCFKSAITDIISELSLLKERFTEAIQDRHEDFT